MIGIRIVWRGDLAEARVRMAAVEAIRDAAEFLLEQANRTVPLEEGTLMHSGSVAVDTDAIRARVSYSTPYARRQHEALNYRHAAGRRAKWLERTFKEQRSAVERMMAARMRTAF